MRIIQTTVKIFMLCFMFQLTSWVPFYAELPPILSWTYDTKMQDPSTGEVYNCRFDGEVEGLVSFKEASARNKKCVKELEDRGWVQSEMAVETNE